MSSFQTPDNRDKGTSFNSPIFLPLQKSIKLAEIFSPEKIGLPDNPLDPVNKVWAREKSRTVYFSIYNNPTVKELAARLEMSEVTTRTHLVDLDRAGFIIRSSGQPTHYAITLAPFIKLLGKQHNAVCAMRDHFKSADLKCIVHEGVCRTSFHSTLHEVAKALQNPERVEIYRIMRNQEAPVILGQIQKILKSESESAAGYALKPLIDGGLVKATEDTAGKYTQREYIALPTPFITVINDLNDEFGEGVILDISNKSKLFDVSALEDDTFRQKSYEKTANLFKALRGERDMDALRWFHKRSDGSMATERARLFEESTRNTEFKRIRKLKDVKLLRTSGKEGSADLLKTNWRPLRKAIYGLLG